MQEVKKCCCPCHAMKGVLIIVLGLIFLLGALDVLSAHTVSIAWPIVLILIGLKKICGGMCKCCSKAGCDKTEANKIN